MCLIGRYVTNVRSTDHKQNLGGRYSIGSLSSDQSIKDEFQQQVWRKTSCFMIMDEQPYNDYTHESAMKLLQAMFRGMTITII